MHNFRENVFYWCLPVFLFVQFEWGVRVRPCDQNPFSKMWTCATVRPKWIFFLIGVFDLEQRTTELRVELLPFAVHREFEQKLTFDVHWEVSSELSSFTCWRLLVARPAASASTDNWMWLNDWFISFQVFLRSSLLWFISCLLSVSVDDSNLDSRLE